MTKFHSDDYIDLIKNVTPENKHIYSDQLYRYNFGDDCPVIDRLYEYCYNYTSAEIVAAKMLNS
jgi:acetoin utilization deacetylase AcuC-like enzyme